MNHPFVSDSNNRTASVEPTVLDPTVFTPSQPNINVLFSFAQLTLWSISMIIPHTLSTPPPFFHHHIFLPRCLNLLYPPLSISWLINLVFQMLRPDSVIYLRPRIQLISKSHQFHLRKYVQNLNHCLPPSILSLGPKGPSSCSWNIVSNLLTSLSGWSLLPPHSVCSQFEKPE